MVSDRYDSPDVELPADLTVAAMRNLDKNQTVEAYREVLNSARGSFARRFHQGVPASALVHMSAAFVDTLLVKA